MNKNKGIIGIGLILAIVLGAIIIGGGAYYLGKSNFQKEKIKLPAQNNSFIKIISPNGQEVYNVGDKISVEYQSLGTSGFVSIYLKNIEFGSESLVLDGTPDKGVADIYTFGINPGDYKLKICNTKEQSRNLEVLYTADCSSLYDYSDNPFTINSSSVLTSLPSKYISSKNWPPVITTSSQSYSCNNIGVVPNTEGNNIITQKTINGKEYCITSVSDHAMSHTYTGYKYTTANNLGTKTVSFDLSYVSCGVYDSYEASQCQTVESNFLDNLDMTIDTIMSK